MFGVPGETRQQALTLVQRQFIDRKCQQNRAAGWNGRPFEIVHADARAQPERSVGPLGFVGRPGMPVGGDDFGRVPAECRPCGTAGTGAAPQVDERLGNPRGVRKFTHDVSRQRK